MKTVLEAVGGIAVAAEFYVLYCVGSTCWYGTPFPDSAVFAAKGFIGLLCGAALIGLLWLLCRAVRARRSRRLGMIRVGRDGSFYLVKK